MSEEEFILTYCIYCEDDFTNYGKNCYNYERCFKKWGIKNETINNRA